MSAIVVPQRKLVLPGDLGWRERSYAFNRIPGERNNRGRVPNNPPPVVAATSPLTILGANTLQWCRSDLGITLATGVSAWADQSGNGHHYAQATGSAQPAYSASDATLNNLPTLTGDGSDDILRNTTLNLPTPATTPTWVWIVCKSVSWTDLDRIVAGENGTTRHIVYQTAVSPQISQFETSAQNANSGLAVGSWGALQAYFSASTSDYVAVNDAAPVTGVSCGGGASSGRTIFGDGVSAGRFGNVAVAEIVYANILPSAGQLSQFAAYRLARYGF